MDIELTRRWFTEKSTISEYRIDGVFVGYMLEDRDRGLNADMPLFYIQQQKIKGITAIPAGRYEVAVTHSNRFGKFLPLLMGVPGFEGIRIHVGNYEKDTLGCLLPGTGRQPDMVTGSKIAFDALFRRIRAAITKEKVFVTIHRDSVAYESFLSQKLAIV